MRAVFALLMFCTAANAECLQWGTDRYGTRVCMINDAVNRNWITPEPQRVIPRYGESLISAAPQPKCEDGWSLVLSGSRPMCAKELREPK